MKIEYLRLENFVNVYAGLKRKKVELDFTKGSNKKILLLGDNGSGKTVLLSSLQRLSGLAPLGHQVGPK